jgi:hypothetical protein
MAFLLALTACETQDNDIAASYLFESVQEIENMSDEQLIELAQELFDRRNPVSKFNVPDFLTPDDFGIEIGSGIDFEKWHQRQTSVNSRRNAQQDAESFFEWYQWGTEYTLDFIGENNYYYSFRTTYIQNYCVMLDNGSYQDSYERAWRLLIYKNNALNYNSDGVPQLARRMLNKKSVRDILDLITWFYVNEHYNYDRHQQSTRVIYRQVEETNDHGGGFIYTYYFITLGLNPNERTDWMYSAQSGVHRTFINGKTGEISDLSSDILKIAYIPLTNKIFMLPGEID